MKISSQAQDWVQQLLKQQPDKKGLRLALQGGGCSGFSYKFELISSTDEDDEVIYFDNKINFLAVDESSLQYLKDAVLDFKTDLMGARFIVDNPNVKTTCGCGESFSLGD